MDHERFCGSRVQRAGGEEVENMKKYSGMLGHVFRQSRRQGLAVLLAALFVAVIPAHGQRGGRGGPPPTAQAGAPFDLTGYWVSVITQNWRLRMVVPGGGDSI